MKKYTNKNTGHVIFGEDQVVGKWPDGSDQIVSELVKLKPSEWVGWDEPQLEEDLNERFQFAKDLMLALARGGVTPSPEYMIDKVKYLFDNKDKLK